MPTPDRVAPFDPDEVKAAADRLKQWADAGIPDRENTDAEMVTAALEALWAAIVEVLAPVVEAIMAWAKKTAKALTPMLQAIREASEYDQHLTEPDHAKKGNRP